MSSAITPLSDESLARILNATIVVPARKMLEGRVYIVIDGLHRTLAG